MTLIDGPRNMKICHVCNAHTVDDGRVFHRTCVGLAKAGYDVHLFAVGQGKEPYFAKGVTIHPLPGCQDRKQRFARRSLVARMATGLMPDLLHVHEPELLGPVIACAESRPVVYDVHESVSRRPERTSMDFRLVETFCKTRLG